MGGPRDGDLVQSGRTLSAVLYIRLRETFSVPNTNGSERPLASDVDLPGFRRTAVALTGKRSHGGLLLARSGATGQPKAQSLKWANRRRAANLSNIVNP